MGKRRAEQGKDAIAQRLRHITVIVMHRVHHELESGIDNRPRPFRIESFNQCRRTFEIGKQGRDGFTFTIGDATGLQRCLFRVDALS